MTTQLIRIGNSQGVRLPKAIIEQCSFEGELEIRVRGEEVVLRKKKTVREGWADDAKLVGKLSKEDKQWLDAPLSSTLDDQWTW